MDKENSFIYEQKFSNSITDTAKKSNEDLIVKSCEMPFIDYKGKIKYFTTIIDIACACDALLIRIKNKLRKEKRMAKYDENAEIEYKIPIAFDMEWPFNFQTGAGRSGVIQLCAEETCCYVFSITQLRKLPVALTELLSHPNVCLHGVNITNDLRKLQRDFPDINSNPMIANCVELGTMCNEVKKTNIRWSLERLVSYVCKLKINKDKKIRMSQWDRVPLNADQLRYAAIDVYIGQVIYRKLQQISFSYPFEV